MKPVFTPHHVRAALEAELLAEPDGLPEVARPAGEAVEFDRVPRPVSLRYRPFERLVNWRLN